MAKIIYNQTERKNYTELRKKAEELRKLAKKNEIPFSQKSASRMVYGWSDCIQTGIRINVGFSWEKEGYQNSQAKRLLKKGLDYEWKYPSVIIVETDVRSTDNQEVRNQEGKKAEEYFNKIRELALKIGLKIEEEGERQLIFKN